MCLYILWHLIQSFQENAQVDRNGGTGGKREMEQIVCLSFSEERD